MENTNPPEAWKNALLLPLATQLYEGAFEDGEAAWTQAIELIGGFAPATELEYRLAVRICIFNIQANSAARWASQPDTTMSQAIRLQNNMLKLTAAAERAEDRLHRLQADRIKRAKTMEAARREPARAPLPQAATPAPQQTAPQTDIRKPGADAHTIGAYAEPHPIDASTGHRIDWEAVKAELHARLGHAGDRTSQG